MFFGNIGYIPPQFGSKGANALADKITQKVTLYPLTKGQSYIMFGEKWCLNKSVMNINSAMHFDCDIDENLMLQAVYLGLLRSPSAHIRLTEVNNNVLMYFSELAPEPVDRLDFTGKTEEEMDKALIKLGKKVFPNKRMNTQLYSVSLVKKPDGRFLLFLRFHHMIADAYALMHLVSEMLSIYSLLKSGEAIPPSRAATLEAILADYEESRDTVRMEEQLRFWDEKIFADEPMYTSANGLGNKKHEFKKNTRWGKLTDIMHPKAVFVNKTVPAELVSRVNAYSREHRVSAKSVYMLAIRSHLARENNYCDDVSVIDSISRRSSLIEKNAGLTRAQSVIARMRYPNEMSFREAAEKLTSEQLAVYKNSIVSLNQIIDVYKQKFGVASMYGYCGVNIDFQPYMIKVPEGMKVHIERFPTGASQQTVYVTMLHVDDSGDMLFNYDVTCSLVDVRSVEAMHAHILRFLELALEDPNRTLEELMKADPLALNIK